MVASGFTDTHRLFLQAAMSRRIMTEVVALDIYARVCQATNDRFDREQFSDFVDQLNTGLNSVELEFRKAQDEVTGTPVIALTNTNGQKIAQVATGYTPTELEYFKHLLDAIVMADDETYCISATAALHEAGHLKNKENKVLVLTKRDAEALLDRFVADKWFIKSANMNNPVCPTCHSAWSGKVLIGLSDKMSAPSKVQRRARRTANGAAAIAGDNEDEDIERDEE
ncbi:hypothetical protein BX616_002322 [Lobosporangium transversale]|nr:hypothetical protein BX616_002322 [Lobosporangium transversale]